MSEQAIPKHLQHWPGLFAWRGGVVVQAPPADIATAQGYPSFPDKGPLTDGMRLTLMTRSGPRYAGEEVRVVHVVEAVAEGRELFVMGPKTIYGEHVDEVLVTPAPPADVWAPATYNGLVLASPAVDYNYEVTTYRFDQAGRHSIQWRLGPLRSNVLHIEVIEGLPASGVRP